MEGNLVIAGEVGRQDVMNPLVEQFGFVFARSFGTGETGYSTRI